MPTLNSTESPTKVEIHKGPKKNLTLNIENDEDDYSNTNNINNNDHDNEEVYTVELSKKSPDKDCEVLEV